MAGKPGIRAVAAEAGVSITTVSHALSGQGKISAQTRQRVQEAAARLGYEPNAVAQAMRFGHLNAIGFVSEEIATTPYAGKIILGAQSAAAELGAVLMIVNIPRGAVEDPQIDALLAHQVDGVVFASVSNRVLDAPARLDPERTVLVDAIDPGKPMRSVVPNEQWIGETATRRLLDAGHRRIAHITTEERGPAVDGRAEGYRAEMTAAGLEPLVVAVSGAGTTEAGARAAEIALRDYRPTAVFAFNDQMAMGVYQEAADRGIGIPDQLSVVGVDDLEIIAAALRPGLTTVALPHQEMGHAAVLLAASGRGHGVAEVTHLPGLLVERQSIAAPPVTEP